MKAIVSLLALACTAQIASAEEYAHVVNKMEVMGSVPGQQRVCENSTVQVQQPNSGGGAVLGGIAGGIIGNAVGQGAGNAVATAAGIVAGAMVGDKMESSSNPVSTQQIQRCHLVQTTQNQVIGYNITYEYAGKQYTTRVSNDPGEWLPVQVSSQGVFPAVPMIQPQAQSVTIMQPASTVWVDQPPAVIYGPGPYYYGPAVTFGIGIGYGRFYGHGRRW
jgi:uncharacterized protein YcfJ